MSASNTYYLAVTVGEYRIALEAGTLERVLPAASVQPAPYSIPAFLGFLVVEEQVVPLLSCHVLLGLPVRDIEPDDHFLMIVHTTPQLAQTRLLLHVEKLLGLLVPEAYQLTVQHIPIGNKLMDVSILKSQWGLLTVLKEEEILEGVDIERIMGLIGEESTS